MAKPVMTFDYHGSFNIIEKYFERLKGIFDSGVLDKYGRKGVEYLKEYTPKRTGKTSQSWSYEKKVSPEGFEIIWHNSNVQNGVNIALILQYGHGTRRGTFVEGVDYINPALAKLFLEIADDAEKEVRGIL